MLGVMRMLDQGYSFTTHMIVPTFNLVSLQSLPQRKSYDAIHSLPKERHPPSHHKSLCIPRRKCHIFMIENAPHMPANSIATNHSPCTIPCHQTPRKLFIPTDARQIRTNENTKHKRKLITQNSDNFRHGAAGYAGCF
jgi:hypothetical protein